MLKENRIGINFFPPFLAYTQFTAQQMTMKLTILRNKSPQLHPTTSSVGVIFAAIFFATMALGQNDYKKYGSEAAYAAPKT